MKAENHYIQSKYAEYFMRIAQQTLMWNQQYGYGNVLYNLVNKEHKMKRSDVVKAIMSAYMHDRDHYVNSLLNDLLSSEDDITSNKIIVEDLKQYFTIHDSSNPTLSRLCQEFSILRPILGKLLQRHFSIKEDPKKVELQQVISKLEGDLDDAKSKLNQLK